MFEFLDGDLKVLVDVCPDEVLEDGGVKFRGEVGQVDGDSLHHAIEIFPLLRTIENENNLLIKILSNDI